ncbi:hypothetical protein HYX04_02510 [Candidatus Woesearchaeota archaeon]|nr:hypothetical protein [Candidatus Woesearchaeota archaeon]
MELTLDGVIEEALKTSRIRIGKAKRAQYLDFLKRQLKTHPHYNINSQNESSRKNIFPYSDLLVDKLLVFSYLLGEISIVNGYDGNVGKRRIKDISDLYLLKGVEIEPRRQLYVRLGLAKAVDISLNKLYKRVEYRHKKLDRGKFPNWSKIIDELGREPAVKAYFKKEITYKMVTDTPSKIKFPDN